MKFTDVKTNTQIDTNDYLESFVDEYTGEIIPDKRVLNKRIRRMWFRSEHPDALIKKEVKVTSTFITLGEHLAEVLVGRTVEEINFLSAVGKSALAHVSIYVDGKNVAEDFALRRIEIREDGNNWDFYTEAAINAAIDRCLIDLGYVVPEEIEKAPIPNNSSGSDSDTPSAEKKPAKPKAKVSKSTKKTVDTVTEAQKAIADIEVLVDESGNEINDTEDFVYDKKTPVEEIMKHLSPADARATVFTCNGKWKGNTVGEAYESDKDNKGFSKTLSWFAGHFVGKDNILVAACKIVNGDNK